MFVADLAEAAAWDGDVMRVSEATYRNTYLPATHKLIAFFGSDVQLEELTPRDVDRWQKWLEEDGIATTSINMYRRVARAMLNRVGYKELAGAIKLLPKPVPNGKALTEAHFQAMLREANVRDAAILLVLRHSGRRRASICQLKVADTRIWQGPDGRFRMASETVEKGKRPQLLFAGHDAAVATTLWLDMRPDPDSPWIFTGLRSGDPLKPNSITQIFAALKRRANIPYEIQASPHALRHAFAQDKLEHFDAKTVAQWMGISVETLLQVYATRTKDELERLYFGD